MMRLLFTSLFFSALACLIPTHSAQASYVESVCRCQVTVGTQTLSHESIQRIHDSSDGSRTALQNCEDSTNSKLCWARCRLFAATRQFQAIYQQFRPGASVGAAQQSFSSLTEKLFSVLKVRHTHLPQIPNVTDTLNHFPTGREDQISRQTQEQWKKDWNKRDVKNQKIQKINDTRECREPNDRTPLRKFAPQGEERLSPDTLNQFSPMMVFDGETLSEGVRPRLVLRFPKNMKMPEFATALHDERRAVEKTYPLFDEKLKPVLGVGLLVVAAGIVVAKGLAAIPTGGISLAEPTSWGAAGQLAAAGIAAITFTAAVNVGDAKANLVPDSSIAEFRSMEELDSGLEGELIFPKETDLPSFDVTLTEKGLELRGDNFTCRPGEHPETVFCEPLD